MICPNPKRLKLYLLKTNTIYYIKYVLYEKKRFCDAFSRVSLDV